MYFLENALFLVIAIFIAPERKNKNTCIFGQFSRKKRMLAPGCANLCVVCVRDLKKAHRRRLHKPETKQNYTRVYMVD